MPEAQDPLLEQEPDFGEEAWAIPRENLVNQGFPVEQVQAALRLMWISERQRRHIIWTQQPQPQDPPQQPQQQQDEDPDAIRQAPDFPNNIPPPIESTLSPSDFAKTKLSKFEWIELWYFTREGCLDAAKPTTSVANDAFGITQHNRTLRMVSASTLKASRNALPDSVLTCDQIAFASKIFIRTMRSQSKVWTTRHVDAMVDFFVQLELHRTMSGGPYADEAVVEYQALIRKEWFDSFKSPSNISFNIGIFQPARFTSIRAEIALRKQAAITVRLSTYSPHRVELKFDLLFPSSTNLHTDTLKPAACLASPPSAPASPLSYPLPLITPLPASPRLSSLDAASPLSSP
jgi:hypothetical protein